MVLGVSVLMSLKLGLESVLSVSSEDDKSLGVFWIILLSVSAFVGNSMAVGREGGSCSCSGDAPVFSKQ